MNLDALLFHLTDALGAFGMILTAGATVASHVIAFAFWRSMAKTFDRPHRWYDTVADWFDEREGLTHGIFVVATVGLGIGIALATAHYDLPTEMMLGLLLIVPVLGTWMGLLARFSKA